MIKNSRPPVSRQSSQASVPKSALKRTSSQKPDSRALADNDQGGQQLQRRKSEPDLKKALQEKDELARSHREKLSRKSSPDLKGASKELRRTNSFSSLSQENQLRPSLKRETSEGSMLRRKNSAPVLRNKMPERQATSTSVSIPEEPHEEKLFFRHMPPSQTHIRTLDIVRGKMKEISSPKTRNITKEKMKSERKKEELRTNVGQRGDVVVWANGQVYRGDLDADGRPHGGGSVFWHSGNDQMFYTKWEHGTLMQVADGPSSMVSANAGHGINNATGLVTRHNGDVVQKKTASGEGKKSIGVKIRTAAKDALKWYLADKPSSPQDNE